MSFITYLNNLLHYANYRSSSEHYTPPYPSAKMTGIHGDTDVGDDDLQFHLELCDTPPPTSTVYIHETYPLKIHDDLGSQEPRQGYVLAKPSLSSHEPEPCGPSLLNSIGEPLDKLQPSPKIMAAQAIEALNRTFVELKSKNEETRLRASYDLRDLVVSAARGNLSFQPAHSARADYA